ncbi:hypothetical protein RhiirC2_784832 [Rhizophagus irregularis]|uniref:Uncharacterized protein n=1 Tax=Rhizophagus irregularis TaxID=588596 RepID=A0A2N1MXP0_9GLOM|nr:hypothetical protein RhiirC2_784832 [Rhizophagus irregularis]
MELEYEDHIINIKYNLSLDHIKLDAYIQLNQQPILDNDEEHQDNPIGIMVDEQEIGNGVYRSIRNLLQIFIPIWSRSNPPILQPGNTINLKLDGDGRNVGRKQNHVLINTMCLLNKKEEVLKPDINIDSINFINFLYHLLLNNKLVFVFIYRQRKIQTLAKVVKYQLQDLQENGISVNDVHWSIDLVTGSLCTI